MDHYLTIVTISTAKPSRSLRIVILRADLELFTAHLMFMALMEAKSMLKQLMVLALYLESAHSHRRFLLEPLLH